MLEKKARKAVSCTPRTSFCHDEDMAAAAPCCGALVKATAPEAAASSRRNGSALRHRRGVCEEVQIGHPDSRWASTKHLQVRSCPCWYDRQSAGTVVSPPRKALASWVVPGGRRWSAPVGCTVGQPRCLQDSDIMCLPHKRLQSRRGKAWQGLGTMVSRTTRDHSEGTLLCP